MLVQTVRRPIAWRPLLHPVRHFRFYSTDIEKLKKVSDTNESDNSASTTGVIDRKHSEVLLYYDHVYPFTLSRNRLAQYLSRFTLPWSRKYDDEKLKEKVWTLSSPLPTGSRITEFVPLKRDCGAFVKFRYPPEVDVRKFIDDIRENVRKNDEARANANFVTKFFSTVWSTYPKVFSVKGVPWIEDLRRFPSPKISVKFEGDPLTEEELYVLFRRYGLINDIQPGPTEAFIYFHNITAAVCAKHCITGMLLDGGKTVLHIQFVPIQRNNFLVNVISNHTRIAIPILFALLATFAVLIFDPIREWFIEYKIVHSGKTFEQIKQNRWFKYLYVPYKTIVDWTYSGYDYLDHQIHEVAGVKPEGDDDDSSSDGQSVRNLQKESSMFWIERYEKSKQLQLWIMENANTFIVVKGPQGSGKEEFVLEHSLGSDDRLNKKVLVLECDKLGKSRSDTNLIDTTASQLGYFPVFTWTNTVSRFVDLGVQGLTGQKSGLSESKETQIKNMFLLATQAIRKITSSEYKKYVKSVERRNNRLKDDEKIEVLREEEFLQQRPESKPIIVLNKFARRADVLANDFVYPLLADWASGLVQNNVAHVIILTADIGSLLILTDALPNQVFKDISLSDASMASSKQYVCDVLKIKDTGPLDSCLAPLGGRMLDLQSFIRRLKSGESPQQAINEMITQAAELITTFFLSSHHRFGAGDRTWNAAQVWLIMKLLTQCETISFSELVKLPLFKASKETMETLTTLEKYDLISLQRDKGVLSKISTGRPLFKAAFENIISDKRIWKLYETDYIGALIAVEVTKIQKMEDELEKIYKIGKVDGRIDYLARKIEASNAKILDYEKKAADVVAGDSKNSSFLGIKF
ncbi:Mitochondrial escape protein 2-2 [Candida viswanathii]|uniref:Mitochondrial escape protein 2 n=1 Tax=Candida viswanathii TaxID=5486 RepID=A0A367YAT8_9ASCO|nr:Mitochondrial escape protein 2-2 [Candida viswanathii]